MTIRMLVGAMLIHPTFISAVSGGTALTIFGLPIYATSYTNSIFPVILSVWVMSKIENFLKKHVPEWLRAIAVPTLTLLIMIPVAFCVVAPIGAFMGTYLAKAIMFLYSTLGFLAYGIFGVLFPIMVMFGMHTALTPYSVQLMSTVGYEPCSIMSFVSTCTLTAISLAVAIRTKNENMRSTGYSCALTAFVGGVTEPAMFGIGLRFKKPFICALIGNFVGGCVAGLYGVQCYALGPANILNVAKFIGGEGMGNFAFAMLGAAVAFVVTFVLTCLAYRSSDPMTEG